MTDLKSKSDRGTRYYFNGENVLSRSGLLELWMKADGRTVAMIVRSLSGSLCGLNRSKEVNLWNQNKVWRIL